VFAANLFPATCSDPFFSNRPNLKSRVHTLLQLQTREKSCQVRYVLSVSKYVVLYYRYMQGPLSV
jgi:hypothetical protein